MSVVGAKVILETSILIRPSIPARGGRFTLAGDNDVYE